MGKRHAENVRRLVPGAADRHCRGPAQRTKQVAEELEIEHAYASIEEMVQRKDIDAVLIATPDKFHAQSIRAAAAAGKDILCEKPLALNLEDAHAALREVSRAGVRLQIGFDAALRSGPRCRHEADRSRQDRHAGHLQIPGPR